MSEVVVRCSSVTICRDEGQSIHRDEVREVCVRLLKCF